MPMSLVEKAVELLRGKYIFADKAEEAATAILKELAAGQYEGLDEAALGERLTATLFEICQDRHLRVRVRDESLHEALAESELEAAWREQQRLTNHGIARVERLDGNVGYLDLRGVTGAAIGGRAIAAAMELVSHTHALIVDLRKNRGGSPDGVIFWTSYFFPDGDTHLNNIYDGATGLTRQYWSLSWLPGERYLDRPVYLLTSDFTFSAGEEFCYNLKAQGRATLIGETTRGGAHPTEAFPITPTFEITVPIARSVNPITGGNWEGTGVEPDVAVPAAQAFDTAYREALRQVLAASTSPTVLLEARTALG
ncbi:S41 family peptidase [Rugosimonospora acidiphila]|uniref:S41 family peptidase n=1 Tax=Rugosimonospora acidiphila TaxID=556531 RepID=A0ABP9RM56_9ACTN